MPSSCICATTIIVGWYSTFNKDKTRNLSYAFITAGPAKLPPNVKRKAGPLG